MKWDYKKFYALKLRKNKANQSQFQDSIYSQRGRIEHKSLPVKTFQLTSSTAWDYNETLS
jgi:hypothetical protein